MQTSLLPKKALSNELLPEPTAPTTATTWPDFNYILVVLCYECVPHYCRDYVDIRLA